MKRDWNEWINLSFINQDWVRINYEKIRTIEISENNCSIYTKCTIRVTFSRIQDFTFTSTAHLTFYLFFFFWGDHSPPSPFCFLWCLLFAALFTMDPRSQTRAIHSIGPLILSWIDYNTGCGLWSLRKLYRRNQWQMKVGQNILVARSFFFFLHYLVFLVVNKVWLKKNFSSRVKKKRIPPPPFLLCWNINQSFPFVSLSPLFSIL